MSNKNKRRSGPENPPTDPVPMEVDQDDANMSEDEEGGTRVAGIYIPPPVPPYCSSESKGPRLIITNITNYNFKSYAGHVSLGPFHHRFSAIIGPNGSGKSNVIDSMLFVFGYRAQKIRSKKLSVLMHNSSKFPNCESCTVGVHFRQILDKDDGTYEEVPNTEFVVARTAFRDNSSYYTVNDKRVHFKEVSKLLKEHGIDLDHNRFLILQGEVESIAMMKPKALTENECGLLEYLEDIVGTSRYKVPLVKINERVETLNEERTEKHNRCKLAEREMKDLEKPMTEAVEYLKLENSLTRSKNLQIQKYLSEQSKKVAELEKERDAAADVLKKHDDNYESLKKERIEKENLVKEEIKQHDALCHKKEEKETALKNSLDQYTKVQATMKATNDRRKKTQAQIQTENKKLDELKKVPEKNAHEIKESEQKIEKLEKQKVETDAKLQENMSTINQETQVLVDEREKLQNKLTGIQENVDKAKSAMTIVESELKICNHNETTEKRKLASMQAGFEESKESLDEKIHNLKQFEEELPQLKTDLQNKQQELNKNVTEEREWRTKLRSIQTKLEETMNAMQQSKSQGKVLDALMRQKNEGHLPGIMGRLGDLGAIDAKYDVAISTCCGRLENIVVDTVGTAQACIEFLKKHDIGRASFIALEKIQQYTNAAHSRIQTPENVPRLFDLVRVEDERILPAFYFALRDTLVADNLDQGQRIAYGARRYRVVTLSGDVIETSGTMSGGGRSQQRGRMGTKVQTKTGSAAGTPKTDREVRQLQENAQSIQERINFLQEQQGVLEREIEILTAKIRQKESEIKKLRINVDSLREQLPRIEHQLKKQEEKVKQTHSDPEKVKELENKVATAKAAYETAKEAADSIQDKVNQITAQIDQISGTKIKDLQNKISSFTKQIDKLTTNISKLSVEIKSSDRNVKKTEDKIQSMEEEVSNCEKSILEGDSERKRLDAEASKLKEEIDKMKDEIDKAAEGSSAIKKEVVALQKKEAEGKMKRLEFEQIMQTIDKKYHEVKDTMPHWRNKLKPLKLHEIPNEPPQEPLKEYTEEELETYKLSDIQYECSVKEEKLNTNKPNLSVIEEFLKKQEVYLQRVQILEDITNERNKMRQLYDDVRKKRFNEFMQGFHIITKKLKEMYQMITLGGDAELELVDSMDPFNEGIVFSVRPPKKSWKMISNLSGGEKTLSSLALVFALHYYKPSPLYVMDEIDAALDFKNVSIVAHYIKERTKNAQFIIISLRSNMFELSDYLIGIYKVHDCTNSLTIKNDPPQFHQNIGSQQDSINYHHNVSIHDDSMAIPGPSGLNRQSQSDETSEPELASPNEPANILQETNMPQAMEMSA